MRTDILMHQCTKPRLRVNILVIHQNQMQVHYFLTILEYKVNTQYAVKP